ncbi:MAG: MoaD/ThiS family protein [Mycobacteriaceae bacterium]
MNSYSASPTEAIGITVTIRYFAAARSAAGVEGCTINISDKSTVANLQSTLGENNQKLSEVLSRCSFLRNSRAILDLSTVLHEGDTIDVLPPFAGG